MARLRENLTQAELAQIVKCSSMTIVQIEKGRFDVISPRKNCYNTIKGKMIRERLRIWVESTKSPIDRRNEIENMFNSNQENR